MTDRILGVACMLLAVAMAAAARHYVAEISYEPVGPRAFPMLLAALLGAAGLWLALKPSPEATDYRGLPLKQVAGVLGAVFVYALTFETLGFTLATTLVAVPVGMAFGGRPLKCLLAGAVLGVGAFYMFDRLLDVVLPMGWLAPVLGAI